MKHLHLYHFCLTFCLLLFSLLFLSSYAASAQSSVDTCKVKMIEQINQNQFAAALQNITCVLDWTFDAKYVLEMDNWYRFLVYADSLQTAQALIDSMQLYMKAECDILGYLYEKDKEYTAAIFYYDWSKIIQESVLGKDNLNYVHSLNYLGILYQTIGDYTNAEQHFLEALEIQKNILGENNSDYATLLNNIGVFYAERGNYSKAEQYYLEALEIRKYILGEQDPDYANSLNNLGLLYANKGDYVKAEKYYMMALQKQKSVLGEQNPDYITSLNNIGSLYYNMEDYVKTEQYYLEVLQLGKLVFGEQHPNYASTLNNLGLLYSTMGNYSKSEQYMLEALKIRKSILGEQHPDYALSLLNLGALYLDRDDYVKAEWYFFEALEILKNTLGEQHPNYLTLLNNIGVLMKDKGDYVKAEQYYLETLQIQKNILGEQHPNFASSLNNIGLLYAEMGDYVKAEQYYWKSLRILNNILGDNNRTYAMVLNNLGLLYTDMGDYAQAEQFYIDGLHISKAIFGEKHPDYTNELGNLGLLYSQMGDYQRSEQFLVKSMQICKEIFGTQHLDYATSLSNLGSLYVHIGDYIKAEQYFLKAGQIQKSVLGEYHPDYASMLGNLGVLYLEMGDYAKAEQYNMKSLEIRKSILGEQHPGYASSLNNFSTLYFEMGNYAKAEQYNMKSLEIRKSVLGEQHPDYASSLDNLVILYCKQGYYSKAEPYYAQDIKINKSRFIKSIDYMTERQREKYWNTIQNQFYIVYPFFSYYYSAEKPAISTFAYDNELFTKGLLLNSSVAVRNSILESGDTTLIRQWNELTEKKQQIQVLEEKDPQSAYLQQVREEAEQLEKQITQSSAAFRESRAQWEITWDSVRNHLAANEVAIEYFVAPVSADSTMYCALLLRHDSEYPVLVPLFEEKAIAPYANTSTANLTDLTYTYDGNGGQIVHLVWDKIQPYIREGETIYFSPAGLFHQLAIEALPYDEDRTLSDVYHMVRLSSTREIAMRHRAPHHRTATLYGGIQYEMSGNELLAESEHYEKTGLLATRSIDNDTINRGTVQYLPGTLQEVENISQMLSKNRIKAQLYQAKAGNEESFKSLSGKRQNILHIATHGFFWTDAVAQRKELFTQRSLMMSFDGNQHTHPTIDPLTRCGLLLAGANTALSGHSKDLPEGVQDGILTAKEISLMDLREADLVVLSACETGRGEITSEGVFGLQRAFKQAGVQTIVMSLWKVSDVATQLLMTEFYRNWLTLGQAKREAFRNAQNTVRQQYEEPSYWAGFVMID